MTRKDMILALRSGLAVLGLMVLPFLGLLLCDVPGIAEVEVFTKTPSSVRIGTYQTDRTGVARPSYERVKGCLGSESKQRVVINLPAEFPDFGICVACSSPCAKITSVSTRRNFILSQRYRVEAAGDVYRCLKDGRGRLAFPILCWSGLGFLFIAICGLGFLGQKLFSQEENRRRLIIRSSAIPFVFWGFVAFLLPLQSVLANRSLYSFPIGSFMIEALGVWIGLTALFAIGLYMSNRSFGYVFHVLLMGGLIYEYVHTGIMAAGEPSINGDVTYYMMTAPKVWDGVVLLIITMVGILLYRKIVMVQGWILLAIGVLLVASAFDVRTDHGVRTDPTPLSVGFCSKLDVAQNAVHSSRRNVMMLILDSVGTEVFLDAIEEIPDLKSAFQGFSVYTNNVGMHDFTEPSVPALMTGELFDSGAQDGDKFHDFAFSTFGTNSLLQSYFSTGVQTSFLPGSFMFGFSYPRKSAGESSATSDDLKGSAFFFRPDVTPPLSLFEIVRFRLVPFAFKYKVLLMTFVGTRSHAGVKDEDSLYPMLMDAPVRDDLPNNLEIFHTDGGHAPFDVDREGNRIAATRKDYRAHLDKTCYALKNLAKLLRHYQQSGIYDKSMIVVAADHAWMPKHPCPDSSAVYIRAFPLLMVKPIDAHGAIRFDQHLTSHSKLKELLIAARDRDLCNKEITGILACDKCVFRKILGEGYDEWIIHSDGQVRYTKVRP